VVEVVGDGSEDGRHMVGRNFGWEMSYCEGEGFFTKNIFTHVFKRFSFFFF
jgi:hypothetical protein